MSGVYDVAIQHSYKPRSMENWDYCRLGLPTRGHGPTIVETREQPEFWGFEKDPLGIDRRRDG